MKTETTEVEIEVGRISDTQPESVEADWLFTRGGALLGYFEVVIGYQPHF